MGKRRTKARPMTMTGVVGWREASRADLMVSRMAMVAAMGWSWVVMASLWEVVSGATGRCRVGLVLCLAYSACSGAMEEDMVRRLGVVLGMWNCGVGVVSCPECGSVIAKPAV